MLLGGGSSPLPSHCLWAPSRTSQVFINKLLWFSQGSSASIAPSGWNLASGTGTDAFLGTLISCLECCYFLGFQAINPRDARTHLSSLQFPVLPSSRGPGRGCSHRPTSGHLGPIQPSCGLAACESISSLFASSSSSHVTGQEMATISLSVPLSLCLSFQV